MDDPEKVQLIAKSAPTEGVKSDGSEAGHTDPIIERVHVDEGSIITEVQHVKVVSRLYFFSQFLVYLGIVMMVVANIVWYAELWSLPSEEAKHVGFKISSSALQGVYLTGMVLFCLASIYVLVAMETKQRGFWWLAYVGMVFTFCEMAIVINRDHDFVNNLVHERLIISGGHKALYVVSCIAVVLVSPAIAMLDMFGDYSVKPSRFHRTLVWMGILMYQVSTIVAVHSYLVQVGFGFTIFGIVVFSIGFTIGKLELRRKEKKQMAQKDSLIE